MMYSKMAPLLLCVAVMTATAATITISYPENDAGFVAYKQTTQSPCVIGDPSCKAPVGFNYTVLPVNPVNDVYDVFSPDYTVGQINTLLSSLTFALGLDLNDTKNAQTLFEVAMYVGNIKEQSWSSANGFAYKSTNNGTGQSDVNFLGFDLNGFQSTDSVKFYLKMEGVNDGRENLFLVNTAIPPQEQVPEPATYALIGGSILALQILRKRK